MARNQKRETNRVARAVDAIKHKDKRKNIPTEELRDFVAEDENSPEDHALSPRSVARSAIGLEGQG